MDISQLQSTVDRLISFPRRSGNLDRIALVGGGHAMNVAILKVETWRKRQVWRNVSLAFILVFSI